MEDKDIKDLGYDNDAETRMPKLWWELGYAAMERMDWMQTHNMGSLQAIMWVGRFRIACSLTDPLRIQCYWSLLRVYQPRGVPLDTAGNSEQGKCQVSRPAPPS
jgi:hypothetical protein